MEASQRRKVIVSSEQKKRLCQLMVKHPKLIMLNHYEPDDTDMLTHEEGRILWHNIATELNAITPGAKRTWRIWRKTWQELKYRTRRQYQKSGELPRWTTLTDAEKEAIGLQNLIPPPEFVPIVGEELEVNPNIENCNKDRTTIEYSDNDCTTFENSDNDCTTIENSDNDCTIESFSNTRPTEPARKKAFQRKFIAYSFQQKKRLLELVVEHPQLLMLHKAGETNRAKQKDCRRIWYNVATELNAMPGVQKPWKMWRKTWQDLKSRTKRLARQSSEVPYSLFMLTDAEKEALGVKNTKTQLHTKVGKVGRFVAIEEVGEKLELGEKEPTTMESCNNDFIESANINSAIENSDDDNDSTVDNSKYDTENVCNKIALVTSNGSARMDMHQQTFTAATSQQRKRLYQFVAKHPKLTMLNYGRPGLTDVSTRRECQRLWKIIATELNNITPGARKTWERWRRCYISWQFHKRRKQKKLSGKMPPSASRSMLTPAEREVLGVKKMSAIIKNSNSSEFVPAENVQIEILDVNPSESLADEIVSRGSISEPESIPEDKVFPSSKTKIENKSVPSHDSHKESGACLLNCEMLSLQEEKKMRMQEDYFNFKKDYLRQKLVFIKMQAEALKSIAKELSNYNNK